MGEFVPSNRSTTNKPQSLQKLWKMVRIIVIGRIKSRSRSCIHRTSLDVRVVFCRDTTKVSTVEFVHKIRLLKRIVAFLNFSPLLPLPKNTYYYIEKRKKTKYLPTTILSRSCKIEEICFSIWSLNHNELKSVLKPHLRLSFILLKRRKKSFENHIKIKSVKKNLLIFHLDLHKFNLNNWIW